jgi:hypothetical protein
MRQRKPATSFVVAVSASISHIGRFDARRCSGRSLYGTPEHVGANALAQLRRRMALRLRAPHLLHPLVSVH